MESAKKTKIEFTRGRPNLNIHERNVNENSNHEESALKSGGTKLVKVVKTNLKKEKKA